MLEAFKNTLPTRLFWVLFPIGDSRQVVGIAKRILTKEKIDAIYEYISKKVTFDMQDSLDKKIDRLTSMMGKLTAQDDDQSKQFKPIIYQGKRRGHTRNFYDQSYGQRNYKIRYRSNSGDRRILLSGRIQYGQNNRDRPRYNQNYRGDFRRGNFRGNI